MGHLSKPGFPCYRPHTGGAMGGGDEDWGHLSQSRFPMIMATHRRCYGEEVGVKNWGHFSQPRCPMIPATHRRCFERGGVRIGKTFPKPGVRWYRPHTGGAIGAGGEDWGHLSQPRCPMILATQRRCYGEGGVGKNWGHVSQPRRPMIPATQRRCDGEGGVKILDTFPKPCVPWYRPHTGGAMGQLSQARIPMLPATHRRYYLREGVKIGDTFPSQAPHVTGHTQAVLWG